MKPKKNEVIIEMMARNEVVCLENYEDLYYFIENSSNDPIQLNKLITSFQNLRTKFTMNQKIKERLFYTGAAAALSLHILFLLLKFLKL